MLYVSSFLSVKYVRATKFPIYWGSIPKYSLKSIIILSAYFSMFTNIYSKPRSYLGEL